MQKPWLLYGDFSGPARTLAHAAKAQGLYPILAGPHPEVVEECASKLSLPWTRLSSERHLQRSRVLEEIFLWVHIPARSGPPSSWFLKACIKHKVHFLDASNDLDSLEALQKFADSAQQRGVLLLPGVNFTALVSDSLTAMASKGIRQPQNLQVAVVSNKRRFSSLSGAASRMMLGLGVERHAGKLRRLPLGQAMKTFRLPHRDVSMLPVPLPELHMAYQTTGILNIRTYVDVPHTLSNWLQKSAPIWEMSSPLFRWLSKAPHFENLVSSWLSQTEVTGKVKVLTHVEGVKDSHTLGLEFPDSDDFRNHAMVHVIQKTLQAQAHGLLTPTQLLGKDFAFLLPGVRAMKFQGNEVC